MEGLARRVRFLEGPACQVRSEGRACHVRRVALDYPSRFGGHDRRAPPNFLSEGRACQVRCARDDLPETFTQRDRASSRKFSWQEE